jgi:mycobactin lysine-N-oxygenase
MAEPEREHEADLIAVGAGAKAAAIAAKVHAINTLGLGPITLRIIEANEPAASWSGRNGMTSGEEPLAITPIKDVGFPYRGYEAFGEAGEAIDRAVLQFSWQQYLIANKSYARWVDAGSPVIQHREYGQYLAWVLSHATAGVTLVSGRVTQVSLRAPADRWAVDVAEPSEQSESWGAAADGRARRYDCRALVLTGPGVHRHLPHDPGAASRIFHCDSQRAELARIPTDRRSDIAIVGGGESALSCAAFLRPFRPDARLTIYTPTLPMSRGESFPENRVFSSPDGVGWSALDLQTRRDFVRHCDRGVFDPGSLSEIAHYERCRFVTGRVVHVAAEGSDRGVCVDYASGDGVSSERYDYLVNCTGFDLLEQLRSLFPPALQAEIEDSVGPLWDRPPDAEVPMGRFLELEGIHPRLHIPGLAALSQGPGFANLGCLGLLADRVLQPLLLGRGEPISPGSDGVPVGESVG